LKKREVEMKKKRERKKDIEFMQIQSGQNKEMHTKPSLKTDSF
jgi:hypothetical protein